jgi:hypothetical protein
MCKDPLVGMDQMVIVVIEEIVVNQVIWYVYLFLFFRIIYIYIYIYIYLFRVLMVYKVLREKKVIVVHLDHR